MSINCYVKLKEFLKWQISPSLKNKKQNKISRVKEETEWMNPLRQKQIVG